MLYQALHTLTQSLNDYLITKFNINDKRAAALCSILEQDGSIPEPALDRIVLTLVKLEQHKNIRTRPATEYPVLTTTAFTKLYVLATACFNSSRYDEGLKFLSESINFFEQKSVFDLSNTPALDTAIEKIIITPVELSLEDHTHLWNSLGCKYRPSVLYLVQVELN